MALTKDQIEQAIVLVGLLIFAWALIYHAMSVSRR